MEEIWKPVVGWKGLYEVSNLGDVRSLDRIVESKSRSGKIFYYLKKEHSILPNKNRYGYLQCILSENNLNKTKLIHRLVAITFIPNPENKPQVNHINGIKTDNRIENLEWTTSQENITHSIKTGLKGLAIGIKNSQSLLTEKQVEEIKVKLLNKKRGIDIAKEYNVHKATISDIKQGKTWSHVLLNNF